MSQTFKAFRAKLLEEMKRDDDAYDRFVNKTNVKSGDEFYYKKTDEPCVVTFIDNMSLYTVFNLESGKTILCTDDYVELVFRLKNGFYK